HPTRGFSSPLVGLRSRFLASSRWTCSRFLVSSCRPLAVSRLSSCRPARGFSSPLVGPLAVPRLLSSDPARGFSSPLVDRSRFLVSARRLLVVPSLLSSTTRGSPALPRLELSNRYTRRLEFPPILPSLKFDGKSRPILTRLE